jgi:hypothetical protein
VYNSTDDINDPNRSSRFGCIELGPDGQPCQPEKIDQESQKSMKIDSEIEKQILGEGLSGSGFKNSENYVTSLPKAKKGCINPKILEQDQLENEIIAAGGEVHGIDSEFSSLRPSDHS